MDVTEDDDDSPEKSIPTLPCPRPRPITPTPENGLVAHPQTQSAFFARLPLEIRQLIYCYMFGNRVVHVQLGYQYPPKPGGAGHAGWATPPRNRTRLQGADYHDDRSNGKRWISRGCACCRNPYRLWWNDGCIVGRDTECSDVRDCTIDARWLLVCRQG